MAPRVRAHLSRLAVLLLAALLLDASGCAGGVHSTPSSSTESAAAAAPQPAALEPDHWPRTFQTADAALTLYQPQVESWEGNQLAFRAAVAAKPAAGGAEAFGVIWGSARTQVDRVTRRVVLEDLKLTRSNFPTAPDGGAQLLADLQAQMPSASRAIALDRIEASLAATKANAPTGVRVKNDVPRILVSQSPAILIPIAGKPVLRAVPERSFERVINTRALIARPLGGATFYAHVYDGWMSAAAIEGPWAAAASVPAGLDPLAAELAAAGQVVLLDGGTAQPKPSLAAGAPKLYVSLVPAELVVFKGAPTYERIPGTNLHRASNTLSDVIVDDRAGQAYLLISGRWYHSQSLAHGPWSYLPSDELPPDFARIPPSSPAGVVLASVAGTPQAQEAAIENSIPQTATVPRAGGPTFSATCDGPPKLAPIAGTPLQYVVNSPTPIIRVDANSWYALRAGVWFDGTQSSGPWIVAASVPQVIYGIPATSPLHYVTYARVYGATDAEVFAGYTPGYLGTVMTPGGVVVYGTGYAYDPWIGNVYYAAPATYGVMAQPVYNPAVGWSYGYGLGLTTAAMVDSWGASSYHYSAAYHGQPCCGSASADVYGTWSNVTTAGTRTYYGNSSGVGDSESRSFDTERGASGDVSHGAKYDYDMGRYSSSSSTSATGAGGSTVDSASIGNDHYASADGNVYKNTGSGWQKAGANGWGSAGGDNSWADAERGARAQGESRASGFDGGGFGGRGGGDFGSHFGGGGFGDRFGEGGGRFRGRR